MSRFLANRGMKKILPRYCHHNTVCFLSLSHFCETVGKYMYMLLHIAHCTLHIAICQPASHLLIFRTINMSHLADRGGMGRTVVAVIAGSGGFVGCGRIGARRRSHTVRTVGLRRLSVRSHRRYVVVRRLLHLLRLRLRRLLVVRLQ